MASLFPPVRPRWYYTWTGKRTVVFIRIEDPDEYRLGLSTHYTRFERSGWNQEDVISFLKLLRERDANH